MKINRIRKIQELLQEKPSLTIDHLCEVFQVSKNTIRRDIAELQKTGCIKKVYGGIVLNEQPAQEEENHPHSWAAEDPHLNDKLIIAKLAADLINDDDVIYIDTGTTTALLLPFIENKRNVTIVTASIDVDDGAQTGFGIGIVFTEDNVLHVVPCVLDVLELCRLHDVFVGFVDGHCVAMRGQEVVGFAAVVVVCLDVVATCE
ncbi:MAG: DeoR/GlpR transcriptional regulator, partial [Selenomonadaceae bacterium]|nr:DeoR/GlpR transcriptional regulator [Selenomonadaceae bacterium]